MSSSCAPFSIELSDFLSDIVTDVTRGSRGVVGGRGGSWWTWGAGAGYGGGVRGREQGSSRGEKSTRVL